MLRIGAFGRPLAHIWPITKSISSIFFRHSKQADTQGGRLRAYNQGDSVVPPSLPYQTIPNHTISYHTSLHHTVPYHTHYHTIPYHKTTQYTPHCTSLLTIPNHTILACTIPYHNTLTPQYTTPRFTIQHHTPLYQPTLRPLARFMSDMNFARPAEALPAKVSHQDLFYFYTFTFSHTIHQV